MKKIKTKKAGRKAGNREGVWEKKQRPRGLGGRDSGHPHAHTHLTGPVSIFQTSGGLSNPPTTPVLNHLTRAPFIFFIFTLSSPFSLRPPKFPPFPYSASFLLLLVHSTFILIAFTHNDNRPPDGAAAAHSDVPAMDDHEPGLAADGVQLSA